MLLNTFFNQLISSLFLPKFPFLFSLLISYFLLIVYSLLLVTFFTIHALHQLMNRKLISIFHAFLIILSFLLLMFFKVIPRIFFFLLTIIFTFLILFLSFFPSHSPVVFCPRARDKEEKTLRR